MSTKADRLGAGNFGGSVSARRQAIAAATTAPTAGARPERMRLDLISFNPDNPREELPDIESLMETFESVGQILAITIATVDAYLDGHPGREGELEEGAQYVVVDGHRRLEAARRIGWPDIKFTVDDKQVTSDERLLEAAFVANYHGKHMSDLEEAEALRKLVAFYGSQSKAAKRLGMSQSVVNQRLSLLKLSPELQADLNEGRRTKEHVRSLGGLSPQEQKAKADERAAQALQRSAGKRAERSTRDTSMGSASAGAEARPLGEERVVRSPAAVVEGTPGDAEAASPEVPQQVARLDTSAASAGSGPDRVGGGPVWEGREASWALEPRWHDVVKVGRRLAEDLTLPERKRLTAYLAQVNQHEEEGTYVTAEFAR